MNEMNAARCYWHPSLEPTGNCSACGLPGCGTCLVREPGGYRCQTCIRKRRPIVQASPPLSQATVSAPTPPVATAPTPPVAAEPQPSWPAQPPVAPVGPPATSTPWQRYIPDDAKVRISLVVLLAGAILPLLESQGQALEAVLGASLSMGYTFWALFWGVPGAWRLWRRLPSRPPYMPGGLFVFLIWWLLRIWVLVVGTWLYSLMGGGIYQFLKHWWAARRQPGYQG